MKKYGIMGGTFNPIHNAHLEIAKRAKEQYGLDEVIFMTGGNPPHKRSADMPDAQIRYEMVKRAVSEEKNFRADDYEVNLREYSYSVNTLWHLKELYPGDELYFIIGGDSARDFSKWYKPSEIAKLCVLLVYPRESKEETSEYAKRIISEYGGDVRLIDASVTDISSTKIRSRIRCGEDVDDMIPKCVWEYINENGIYKK